MGTAAIFSNEPIVLKNKVLYKIQTEYPLNDVLFLKKNTDHIEVGVEGVLARE